MTAPRPLPAIVEAVAGDADEAARRDLFLAPVLERADGQVAPSRLIAAAKMRVQHGPLVDALSCLPSAGDGDWLLDPDQAPTRARVQLLIWEAGGGASVIPRLGPWLGRSDRLWAGWVLTGAQGGLRQRVLAARLLEIAADGLAGPDTPTLRREQARRIVTRLAEHPEAMIWIPGARALGRLAARDAEAQAILTRWLQSDHPGERRRGSCAAACVPSSARWWPEEIFRAVLEDETDPWAMAALGPALPYLACERRELWLQLAERLQTGQPGPEVLWSVVQGLLSLALRDALDRPGRAILGYARERARSARTRSTTQAQLWLEIQRQTDFLDHLDPDPEDLDLLMQRTVRAALHVGPARVAERARALAGRIEPVFRSALDRAQRSGALKDHAAALATLESCTRAAALSMWVPLLQAADEPAGAVPFEDLGARLFEAQQQHLRDGAPDYPRHRTALRCLGLLLDIRPSPLQLPRGAVAALGDVDLSDKRRRSRFKKPVSDVLFRLLDRTSDLDVMLPATVRFARFSAWWALAAGDVTALQLMARSTAAARKANRSDVLLWVEDLTSAVVRGHRPGDGGWTARVVDALDALHARDTALRRAVERVGRALGAAAGARRTGSDEARLDGLRHLAAACTELAAALSAPERGLAEADATGSDPSDEAWPVADRLEQATDALRAAAIDRDVEAVAAAWSEGLGPVLGGAVQSGVQRLLTTETASFSRTPTRKLISDYRLVDRLGAGGQGEVWLVERTHSGRRFVMKLLSAHAEDGPHAHLLNEALQSEAALLKRIYHPNVANFVDSGLDAGKPFLVLEYLVGCDLEAYAKARTMTIEELKPVVQDIASGLEALSSFGLVHCDLKPQNIYLQLALPHDRPRFDPKRDRDPTATPLLSAVVIDFGIARSMASLGRDDNPGMSGTLGYIAPEQTDGRIHPRTDVYALAATVFRGLTGRLFFEHLSSVGAKLLAHGSQPPMREAEARAAIDTHAHPELWQLLDDATAVDPETRPDVAEFSRRFQEL